MASPEAKSTVPRSELDLLVDQVLAGDTSAWSSFVDRAHPIIVGVCRQRRFVGGFSDPEDTARDIALRTLDRIQASDFAALRAFASTRLRHPDADFKRWLRVLVSNTYVDYLRGQPEYQRKRVESTRRLERLTHEPIDEGATASRGIDIPTAVEIRRILDCLAADTFPRPQRIAITLWLRGDKSADIARELGVTETEARKLLEAGRQRLRRAVHKGRNR